MEQHKQGYQVSLASLEGFTPEESAHLAGVAQKQQGPVKEEALRDYMSVIRRQYSLAHITQPDDLMALRDAMRDKKGYNG